MKQYSRKKQKYNSDSSNSPVPPFIEKIIRKSSRLFGEKTIRTFLQKCYRSSCRNSLPEDSLNALCEIIHSWGNINYDDTLTIDPSLIERIQPYLLFLYHVYFRIETKGLSHIPRRSHGIIVSNHSGGLPYDAAMITTAILHESSAKRLARVLVDDFVFGIPLLGSLIQRCGGVRANPSIARKLLKQKELICVFPEGTKGIGKPYEQRYQLKRFGRGGFIRLAMQERSKIIPTAVIGAEEIHPIIGKLEISAKPLGVPFIPITPTFPWLGPLGLIPLPSRWKIIFGKPLSFASFSAKDAQNEKLVQQQTEHIRNIIQNMIQDELETRNSPWI
jgi:1-acyl-sn-glycerol-3-phosphate acyltransferase